MASTYSDRLRLELMGAGDQSGTWGTTTNTNLGTLIEEAIAGLTTIAMGDANQTLNALDGATDQARKMILKLTGTLTATRQVIVPQKEKLYIVDCGSLSGGKAHIKTSAATGVEVSPGLKTVVYCDGTNVVSVLPQALNESTTTNNVLSYNGTNWVAVAPNTIVTTFSPGMIIMWNGSIANIPTGWGLCDGSTYAGSPAVVSPDLRDRFVIGANQDDSGVAKTNITGSLTLSGGSKDAVIPSHTHTASFSGNSHYHNVFHGSNAGNQNLWDLPSNAFQKTYATARRTAGADGDVVMGGTNSTPNGGRTANATQGGTVTVSTTGSSATDANLPPYYALAYIIKKP